MMTIKQILYLAFTTLVWREDFELRTIAVFFTTTAGKAFVNICIIFRTALLDLAS